MRDLLHCLITLVASFSTLMSLNAGQWQPLGPYNAQLSAMAEHKGVLFAAAFEAGVYTSTNKGESWQPLNTGLKSLYLVDLIEYKGKLLLTAYGEKPYIFDDAKQRWQTITSPLSTAFICFCEAGDSLFAGSYEGVYLSTDGGASWVASNTGIKTEIINKLYRQGNTMLAIGNVKAYRSTDNGKSWTDTQMPDADYGIGSGVVVNGVLTIPTYKGIYRMELSPTGTWQKVQTTGLATDGHPTIIVYVNGNYYLSLRQLGLYRSSDANNWEVANNEDWVKTNAIGMTVYANELYLGTPNNGIHKTTDGKEWKSINTGISPPLYSAHCFYNNALQLCASRSYLLSLDENSLLWKEGKSWYDKIPSGAARVILPDAKDMYVGTADGVVNRYYGDSALWHNVIKGIKRDFGQAVVGLSRQSGVMLVALDDGAIFRTTDDGANWSLLVQREPGYTMKAYSDTLLLFSSGSGLYKSRDKGQTWSKVLSVNTVKTMVMLGDVLYVGTSNGRIHFSTNGGENWSAEYVLPTGNKGAVTAIEAVGGSLYVATADKGLFLLQGEMGAWKNALTDFPFTKVLGVFFYKDYLYAAADSGLYRIKPETITDVQEETPVISAASVKLSVYPQPASEKLHFSCEQSIKHIVLVDMLGNKVGEFQGNSTNAIDADVSHLPSGVYTALIYTSREMLHQGIILSR